MRLIIIFVAGLLSLPLQAEIVSPKVRRQVNFNFRFIQEVGSDLKRQERSAYGLAWSEPIWRRLRMESGIFWAPDEQVQPRAIKVSDDWLGLFGGLEWSHPWYFRWFVASGFIWQNETSTIQLKLPNDTQTRSESRYQAYPYLRGGVDYAFNRDFELRFELGTQKRNTIPLLDLFWGISFAYNIP